MKSKIAPWGNSHGIRITRAMLDHLHLAPGEEVDIHLTERGLEIVKKDDSITDVERVTAAALDDIVKTTQPVQRVNDPYEARTDVDYRVVALNPCHPLIREVPKGTPHAYATLADAKEAARQVLQAAIAQAKHSLAELRQLGIDDIHYITL